VTGHCSLIVRCQHTIQDSFKSCNRAHLMLKVCYAFSKGIPELYLPTNQFTRIKRIAKLFRGKTEFVEQAHSLEPQKRPQPSNNNVGESENNHFVKTAYFLRRGIEGVLDELLLTIGNETKIEQRMLYRRRFLITANSFFLNY
jgi:hypothetical protein